MSGPAGPSDADAADPDAELLRRHVAGDPDAFAELVRRHRDRLWAVAVRTLGDPEDAADALQDALLAAYRRAGSFRGDARVTTWLHRVVVNACIDRLRRERTRATSALPERPDGSLDERALHARPDAVRPARPDELVEVTQTRLEVAQALATLPVEQRAALVLVDMEGYSVAEAALILGCAEGTVKSRCARGRARLLPLLSPLRDAGNRRDPRNQTAERSVGPVTESSRELGRDLGRDVGRREVEP